MNSVFNYDLTASLQWIIPELWLTVIILLMTLMAMFFSHKPEWIRTTALAMAAGQVILDIRQWSVVGTGSFGDIFGHGLLMTGHDQLFWIIVTDVFLMLLIALPVIRELQRHAGEYYVLLAGITMGVHLLVMATHMLIMFISLEIISLSSYLLVSLSRNSVESGLKYFLFGAAATAVMLYGISLWYGLNEELSLLETTAEVTHPGPLLLVSMLLISSGILFKISSVPWHIWVPDVYDQSPVPVVAALSVLPKIGGFALAWKWLDLLQWPGEIVAVLAVLTMSVGNFAALRQKNIKRMMAYSSIAHSGFLLMALITPETTGYFRFYLVIYGLMNLATFFLLYFYERRFQFTMFQDYEGILRSAPRLAGLSVLMVLCMVSLSGIPPTAGFTAKLLLFTGVSGIYGATGDPFLLFVLVFGLINTVVALAYYIRLPYVMIFRPANNPDLPQVKIFTMENFLGGILVLAVLLLFFKPDWLMGWINSVSFVL